MRNRIKNALRQQDVQGHKALNNKTKSFYHEKRDNAMPLSENPWFTNLLIEALYEAIVNKKELLVARLERLLYSTPSGRVLLT